MNDFNRGALPVPCLRLDYGFGEQWASVELGDGTGYVRLTDYEKLKTENDKLLNGFHAMQQLYEDELKHALAENAKLRELAQRMHRYMADAVEHCGHDVQTTGYTMLGSRVRECEEVMRELGMEEAVRVSETLGDIK